MSQNVGHLSSVNFFAHNDMDMMEIGNGNLTIEEERTHFAVWVFMKSPILLGTDVRDLSFRLSKILAETTASDSVAACESQLRRGKGNHECGASCVPPGQHLRRTRHAIYIDHNRRYDTTTTVLLWQVHQRHSRVCREHQRYLRDV